MMKGTDPNTEAVMCNKTDGQHKNIADVLICLTLPHSTAASIACLTQYTILRLLFVISPIIIKIQKKGAFKKFILHY